MKTTRCLLLSVFAITLLYGCSKEDKGNGPEFQLKASDNLDELDYRLYSLVLKELFVHSENLVVYQETGPLGTVDNHSVVQSIKNSYPLLDTTVFYDVQAQQDTGYLQETKFDVPSKKVHLVTDEEINYIFNTMDINDGWIEFYRRYPNSPGTISFSRIGYNADKTQAMVNMGNMYASLGGEGFLIFLILENNEWKIILSLPTWIS